MFDISYYLGGLWVGIQFVLIYVYYFPLSLLITEILRWIRILPKNNIDAFVTVWSLLAMLFWALDLNGIIPHPHTIDIIARISMGIVGVSLVQIVGSTIWMRYRLLVK